MPLVWVHCRIRTIQLNRNGDVEVFECRLVQAHVVVGQPTIVKVHCHLRCAAFDRFFELFDRIRVLLLLEECEAEVVESSRLLLVLEIGPANDCILQRLNSLIWVVQIEKLVDTFVVMNAIDIIFVLLFASMLSDGVLEIIIGQHWVAKFHMAEATIEEVEGLIRIIALL